MFTPSRRPRPVQFFIAIVFAFSLAAGASAQSDRLAKSFAEVAKKVGPAVVSIDTKSRTVQPVAKGTPAPGDSDDIMEFFRKQLPTRPVYAVGSGFIVDKSGYVMTNAHVIIRSVQKT